jgi:threonine/homoserine/homoserine lactone efflux protein
MVLKNALTQSISAGIYTAIGIATGVVVLFLLSIFGIGQLVVQSKLLFMLLKMCGGVYLIYIALKAIFSKVSIKEPQLVYQDDVSITSGTQFYKMGLICNLTNPKAFMFILALSTYVVEHGNRYSDGLVIVILAFIATVIWFSLVTLAFGNIRVRRVFYTRQKLINIIFGVFLLYVASRIIIL